MKILLVRFSSIGDIVLCSPVIRCIKKRYPNAEIHFATKAAFEPLLQFNPHIHTLHLLFNDFVSFKKNIAIHQFDFIVDLHKNLRSKRLLAGLSGTKVSFNKLHIQKWLSVKMGNTSYLPKKHLVERYMDALLKVDVPYDDLGLDYFEGPNTKLPDDLQGLLQQEFNVVAIGGQHATKRMPPEKIIELLAKSNKRLILLGGKEDQEIAETICKLMPKHEVLNLCGKLSINQSALLVKHAAKVISHDTGLMHIAAAYKKTILSIWGSTVPEFGMYPFFPSQDPAATESLILQAHGLSCRPCSKIGFKKCPKNHFNCMLSINFDHVNL